MVLNNYWRLKRAVDAGVFKINSGSPVTSNIGLVNVDGNEIPTVTESSSTYLNTVISNMQLKYNLGIMLGTDDTAPQLDNYCLGNNINSSIQYSGISVNTTFSEGIEKTIVTITGENTTENDILVKEIGLIKRIMTSQSSNADVMLLRDVLSAPLTLKANDGFSFMFTWEEGIPQE